MVNLTNVVYPDSVQTYKVIVLNYGNIYVGLFALLKPCVKII